MADITEEQFIERAAKDRALVAAVMEWCANNEGQPNDPNDAELLKALWQYEGDRTEPCPECDGDCGEPCAPCTVKQACGGLDRFIADYNKRHGFAVKP